MQLEGASSSVLSNIVGSIPITKRGIFEKILYRATRGNVILNYFDVPVTQHPARPCHRCTCGPVADSYGGLIRNCGLVLGDAAVRQPVGRDGGEDGLRGLPAGRQHLQQGQTDLRRGRREYLRVRRVPGLQRNPGKTRCCCCCCCCCCSLSLSLRVQHLGSPNVGCLQPEWPVSPRIAANADDIREDGPNRLGVPCVPCHRRGRRTLCASTRRS